MTVANSVDVLKTLSSALYMGELYCVGTVKAMTKKLTCLVTFTMALA